MASRRPWLNCLRHFSLHLVLIVYTVVGGFIFQAIEKPHEDSENSKRVSEARKIRQEYIKQLMELYTNFTELRKNGESSAQMDVVQQEGQVLNLLIDYEKMLGKSRVGITKASDFDEVWNLWHAIFYAGTLYTTIGYGSIFCKTRFGQAMTMVYSLLGIPLLLCVINDMSKVMYKYATIAYFRIRTRVLNRGTVGKINPAIFGSKGQSLSVNTIELQPEKNIPAYVAVILLCSYVIIGAATFLLWETQWDFWTAFYFFYVSLATIGLGDIVPEQVADTILAWILIVVGLSLVSLCFSIMYTQLYAFYFRMTVSRRERFALEEGQLEWGSNGSLGSSLYDYDRVENVDPDVDMPPSLDGLDTTTLGIFQVRRDLGLQQDRKYSMPAIRGNRSRRMSLIGASSCTVSTQTDESLMINGGMQHVGSSARLSTITEGETLSRQTSEYEEYDPTNETQNDAEITPLRIEA